MNYFATEIGLTKATKALLANKSDIVPPAPVIAQDNEYRKPAHLMLIKRYEPKGCGKRKIHSKLTEEALEDFQQNRLFQVIRNENHVGR